MKVYKARYKPLIVKVVEHLEGISENAIIRTFQTFARLISNPVMVVNLIEVTLEVVTYHEDPVMIKIRKTVILLD